CFNVVCIQHSLRRIQELILKNDHLHLRCRHSPVKANRKLRTSGTATAPDQRSSAVTYPAAITKNCSHCHKRNKSSNIPKTTLVFGSDTHFTAIERASPVSLRSCLT